MSQNQSVVERAERRAALLRGLKFKAHRLLKRAGALGRALAMGSVYAAAGGASLIAGGAVLVIAMKWAHLMFPSGPRDPLFSLISTGAAYGALALPALALSFAALAARKGREPVSGKDKELIALGGWGPIQALIALWTDAGSRNGRHVSALHQKARESGYALGPCARMSALCAAQPLIVLGLGLAWPLLMGAGLSAWSARAASAGVRGLCRFLDRGLSGSMWSSAAASLGAWGRGQLMQMEREGRSLESSSGGASLIGLSPAGKGAALDHAGAVDGSEPPLRVKQRAAPK